MNDNQFAAIKYTIETIEKDIKQCLTLDQLSEKAGISKYHLHHLFKSITDKTLMSYVRDRRLCLSLTDLINTNLNIIDIANEYQFGHEQSYIRAFKQKFKMTPAQFRKLPCEMPIEQKIDINYLYNVGQGIVIQPRMCMQPRFFVQGIKEEIIHKENLVNHTTNKLAQKFRESYLPLIHNRVNEDVYIGLVIYSKNPQYSNEYITCVETASLNKIEEPFVNYTIPLQEYAVFRYIGFHSPYQISYETLLELYNYIEQWHVITAYRRSKPFHIEKINLRICSESYCEMDIYYPISVR